MTQLAAKELPSQQHAITIVDDVEQGSEQDIALISTNMSDGKPQARMNISRFCPLVALSVTLFSVSH